MSQAILIGETWADGEGAPLESHDPAQGERVVWSGRSASTSQVDAAVAAARQAGPAWAALSAEQRYAAVGALSDATAKHAEELSKLITSEMGKPVKEALIEAKSLPGKMLASFRAIERLPDLALPGAPGSARWRPHGVIAVIGPYNFPVHLVNAHVCPAILAGNTVVIKASELAPASVALYVRILREAGVPAGVVNVVQGRGDVGAHLSTHPDVAAVAFTGSWATGRRIREATLDDPSKLLALEMGGKNLAVVLDDADLGQSLHEILTGALLTAGQRCTATSRVLVHKNIAAKFEAILKGALERIEPGNPFDAETVMGPLVSVAARDKYLAAYQSTLGEGITELLAPRALDGGAFVTPALRRVEGQSEAAQTIRRTEFFAPDISIEVVDDDEAALDEARANPFGLSLSVFTSDRERFERFVQGAPSGVFNWNRSTNNASGLLPFGGLGWSGNQRAAGSAAALYCAHPIAVIERQPGEYDVDPRLAAAIDGLT